MVEESQSGARSGEQRVIWPGRGRTAVADDETTLDGAEVTVGKECEETMEAD